MIKVNDILNRSLVVAGTMALTSAAPAQNPLQFTSVNANVEGAIQLHWASNPGEVYQVDYADALVDLSSGPMNWNKLYADYPSHGTNTFWLDTGDYLATPAIPHPKQAAMRFYRIALTATDDAASEPLVSITSPSGGSTVSGDLTVLVSAQTDQATLLTKLYVDGQEMLPSVDTTNYSASGTNYFIDTYTINTCEWPNGPHTLFATAKCASDLGGPINGPQILIGHAVSPYLTINFDNLITRFSFSEPFFNPDVGQTQHVSAVFAANCDWTLQVQDASTNTVRYATGSGPPMSFDWDGNGTNGSYLPAGTYTYLLSVQTNGQQMLAVTNGGGDPSIPPSPSLSEAQDTELWAIAPGASEIPVPLAIYPPGFDTNGFTIFEAAPSEVLAFT